MSLTIETARMMDNAHLIAALEAEGMGPRIQELVNRIEILEDEAQEYADSAAVLAEYEMSALQLKDLLEATGDSTIESAELLRTLRRHDCGPAKDLDALLDAVELLRSL